MQHAVPRRVAHNDAKLDNFLFRNGRAVCVVDLDTLMPGQWLWDVGDLVRSAASRGAEDDPEATVDEKAYESILTAYREAVSAVATATEAQAVAAGRPRARPEERLEAPVRDLDAADLHPAADLAHAGEDRVPRAGVRRARPALPGARCDQQGQSPADSHHSQVT